MIRPTLILLPIFLTLLLLSCKKDSFIKGGNATIVLSADTLHFDTLFTTAGSVTQAFKVFNRNNQKILISNISLGGGNASFFKINADGFQGPDVKDLEMQANDSLYVFVTVKIDPSSAALPFIAQDSININYNGAHQSVQLDAWGQNATFLRSAVISANTTWTNDRPYVILGGLQVNENTTLTIQKGTKIYLHSDAAFLVDGTLKANGEKADSMEITFTSDRLDYPYTTYPGAWPGIYFSENSRDNVLKHVIVKNAFQGIVAQDASVDSDPKLVLDKCTIDNCYDAGIIGVHTSIQAVSCLVSNCGKNIQFVGGGDYALQQCTVASYSNSFIAHKNPVLTITNYVQQGAGISSADLTATFRNCIFWGDNGTVDDEVVSDQQGAGVFRADFKNCLWKLSTEPAGVTSSGMILNQDPFFNTIDTRNNEYDFHLGNNSPALGAGIATGITTDLDDLPRDPNFPDLGAYEATF